MSINQFQNEFVSARAARCKLDNQHRPAFFARDSLFRLRVKDQNVRFVSRSSEALDFVDQLPLGGGFVAMPADPLSHYIVAVYDHHPLIIPIPIRSLLLMAFLRHMLQKQNRRCVDCGGGGADRDGQKLSRLH